MNDTRLLINVARSIVRAVGLTGLSLARGAEGDCPKSPPNQQPAGHVVGVQGDWRLKADPGRSLTNGCKLPPRAEIVRISNAEYAKIAVVDWNGKFTSNSSGG